MPRARRSPFSNWTYRYVRTFAWRFRSRGRTVSIACPGCTRVASSGTGGDARPATYLRYASLARNSASHCSGVFSASLR